MGFVKWNCVRYCSLCIINPALNWQYDQICLLPFVLISRKFPCHLASRQCWLNRGLSRYFRRGLSENIAFFEEDKFLIKLLIKQYDQLFNIRKIETYEPNTLHLWIWLPSFLFFIFFFFFWHAKYLSYSLKLILIIAISWNQFISSCLPSSLYLKLGGLKNIFPHNTYLHNTIMHLF